MRITQLWQRCALELGDVLVDVLASHFLLEAVLLVKRSIKFNVIISESIKNVRLRISKERNQVVPSENESIYLLLIEFDGYFGANGLQLPPVGPV